MSRDNEYLTSNRRIRYPFADDTVLKSGDSQIPDEKALPVFGCFVDAMVQVKSAYSGVVPVIKGISIDGHTLSFRLCAADESEASTLLTCTRSSDAFPVISSDNEWCWYTFVMSSDGIREYEHETDRPDVSETEIRLSDRCIGVQPGHVTSILMYDGVSTNEDGRRYTLSEALQSEPNNILSGNVRLSAGYNMSFSNTETEFDIGDTNPEVVSLNAIPGAGLGVITCSDETEGTVFKTPGLLCDDGHARVFNDTCYDLVPDKYEDQKGLLKIHAKCKACCTCEMYASIVNDRLVPLKDSILGSRESLNRTLDKYEENVTKWNYRIANAQPEDIIITTTGVALDAAATDLMGDGVTGKMNRCGYSIMVRNDSFVDVDVKFSYFYSNGDPFEAQVSYMGSDNTPIVTPVDLEKCDRNGIIFSIRLPPGRSMTLTYFIRLSKMVKTDSQTGFLSRMTVSAYQEDRKIISTIKELGI